MLHYHLSTVAQDGLGRAKHPMSQYAESLARNLESRVSFTCCCGDRARTATHCLRVPCTVPGFQTQKSRYRSIRGQEPGDCELACFRRLSRASGCRRLLGAWQARLCLFGLRGLLFRGFGGLGDGVMGAWRAWPCLHRAKCLRWKVLQVLQVRVRLLDMKV